ncbi:hypothetical protein [Candidatus Brocadia sapporoensis]|uniref:hypothetical protein n=1 Tax=Candidatus Brocadia sapporoensis TaxID=392547 RepID=UPI001E430996|nr:hypothetical protein [Candidatus Brocadia sapporoensis]
MLRLCSVAVSQSDGEIAVINSRMFTLITGVFFVPMPREFFRSIRGKRQNEKEDRSA